MEVKEIHLVREGDHAVVKFLGSDGVLRECIREHVEGPFSHCVSESGLQAIIRGERGVDHHG